MSTSITGILVLSAIVCCTLQISSSQFAPPQAFYPFPNWVPYPFYQPFTPSKNFTNATTINGTYRGLEKYYFPPSFYNNYNYSAQYGSNLFIGYIWPVDRLLFNQSFIKSARWWSSRQKVIEYPGYTPGHVRNETITAIRIYDHQLNGQTGYASILRGGVGYKNITIRLYSGGAGRGFNFLVQIFGH